MTNYIKLNKPFPIIKAPYRMFTGIVLNQSQCDFINRLSTRINDDYNQFGETQEVRLNERHRIVNDMAMGAR